MKSENRKPKTDPLRRRDSAARRGPKAEIRKGRSATLIHSAIGIRPALRDFGLRFSNFGIEL
jgi:hypothetical protein